MNDLSVQKVRPVPAWTCPSESVSVPAVEDVEGVGLSVEGLILLRTEVKRRWEGTHPYKSCIAADHDLFRKLYLALGGSPEDLVPPK